MKSLSFFRALVLILVPALSLGACKSEPEPTAGDEASAGKDKPAPKAKELSTLIIGKVPHLPSPFKGLTLGMTSEEAKAVHSGMPQETRVESAEYPDGYFQTGFDKETGKLRRMYFSLPKAKARDWISKAWGEPKVTQDLGKDILVWFDADTGLRAALSESFGDDMNLEFTLYMPVVEMLGKDGPELAFESPQKILGATLEQLRAGYPNYIVEVSQDKADKDRKGLEKMAGKDKVAILGKARPSVHLDLPPTEYGKYWTRLNMSFDDAGTVERYWFGIDYESYPPARAELLALFKAKFGDGKPGKRLASDVTVFSESPFITLEDQPITKEWQLHVDRKK